MFHKKFIRVLSSTVPLKHTSDMILWHGIQYTPFCTIWTRFIASLTVTINSTTWSMTLGLVQRYNYGGGAPLTDPMAHQCSSNSSHFIFHKRSYHKCNGNVLPVKTNSLVIYVHLKLRTNFSISDTSSLLSLHDSMTMQHSNSISVL